MNKQLLVPVDGRGLDWPRRVANAVNHVLLRSNSPDHVHPAVTLTEPGFMTSAMLVDLNNVPSRAKLRFVCA